jgi:hypothetical protein
VRDPHEQARQIAVRQMRERIERGHRVERRRRKVQPGHVALHDPRIRNGAVCALNLFGRNVNPRWW